MKHKSKGHVWPFTPTQLAVSVSIESPLKCLFLIRLTHFVFTYAQPSLFTHCVSSPPPTPVHTGVYSFGLFTTTIFANTGQVVTGNQTPHFLSACRPNYTALGCHSPLHYIAERRACTGNPYLVASARKSFPSKDAALSFYSAIYTVVGKL